MDDFLDEYEDVNDQIDTVDDDIITQDTENLDDVVQQPSESPDLIQELLRSKGITDSSKIKFENEEGEVTEVDWNTLSVQDQLGILSNNEDSVYEQLDNSEIALLNAIRNSKMSPQEYLNYVQQSGIQHYLANQQVDNMQYSVDGLNDEELFLSDIIAKVGDQNITNEELEQLLDSAKANPTTFKKQVDAIRNEYKSLEYNNYQQEVARQRQEQMNRYNSFAETVEDEIRSFTDVYGYSLNMNEDEMEELYDFITGFDDAGVSIFSKALNDPKLLVRMAWFALNGEDAIRDIDTYWTNELKNSRRNNEKQEPKKSNVEIRSYNNPTRSTYNDDLDNF